MAESMTIKIKFKGVLEYEKSTNLRPKISTLNTIISYFTILYHINADSQYVINVVKIAIKMLYKNPFIPYF